MAHLFSSKETKRKKLLTEKNGSYFKNNRSTEFSENRIAYSRSLDEVSFPAIAIGGAMLQSESFDGREILTEIGSKMKYFSKQCPNLSKMSSAFAQNRHIQHPSELRKISGRTASPKNRRRQSSSTIPSSHIAPEVPHAQQSTYQSRSVALSRESSRSVESSRCEFTSFQIPLPLTRESTREIPNSRTNLATLQPLPLSSPSSESHENISRMSKKSTRTPEVLTPLADVAGSNDSAEDESIQQDKEGGFKFDIACAVRCLVKASKSIQETVESKREIDFRNKFIGNRKPQSQSMRRLNKTFSGISEGPLENGRDHIRRTKAAFCIQRLYYAARARRFARNHLLFRSGFLNVFNVMLRLKKALVSWRRHRAADLLDHFLRACGHRRVKETKLFTARIMVFSKSVRLIQCAVRDFLACKKARITALERIWDAYEYQYISSKCGFRNLSISSLNSRPTTARPKALSSSRPPSSRPSTSKRVPLEIDDESNLQRNERLMAAGSSTRGVHGMGAGVISRAQEKRWTDIDSKFKDFVERKSTGGMSPKAIICSHLLPKHTRYPYFTKVIDDARHMVVMQYTTSLLLQQEQAVKKDPFSLTDAAHLMTHTNDDFLISRVKHQLNQVEMFQTTDKKKKKKLTFIFYKMVLDDNLICKSVRKAHEVNKTFENENFPGKIAN